MQQSDLKEFLEVMFGMAENFSADLTDKGATMRFEALKAYDIEQIKESSMIILRTRKYTSMPTVADFVEAIEGDGDDLAEIQASLVNTSILNIGSNPIPIFDDPVTSDIIFRRIGWQKIRHSDMKEIPFIIKDFKSLYKTFNKAASGNLLNAPPELKGLLENLTKRIE